jgi:hypothetical protein
MSDGSAILLTIASTAVGSAASWFISRWYYRRSGSDLDAALRPLAGNDEKTLQAVNAIGRVVEQNGQGKFSRDEAGNITGIVITATGHAKGSSQATAVGRATYSPPSQYDRQHEQPPTPEPEGDHA